MSYYSAILLLTALTLVIAIVALRDFAAGSQQSRALASRSAMLDVERRADSPMSRLDVALRKTELGRQIERRIIRAGVKIKVSTFLVLMIAASTLTIVFVWRAVAPIFGIASVILVAYVFLAYLKRQEERRKEEFTAQLPEVARVLSNATSAGLALPTAVDMASEELDDPAGVELRRVAQSLKVGQSFDSAMADLRERMPSREIGVLVSTLLVASRSGGALVTSLRNISATLEDRKETYREVKTIMSESTSSAWALAVMSIGALLLVNLINPGVIKTMTESFGGQVVLGVSCALMLAGVMLVRQVTKIKH